MRGIFVAVMLTCVALPAHANYACIMGTDVRWLVLADHPKAGVVCEVVGWWPRLLERKMLWFSRKTRAFCEEQIEHSKRKLEAAGWQCAVSTPIKATPQPHDTSTSLTPVM